MQNKLIRASHSLQPKKTKQKELIEKMKSNKNFNNSQMVLHTLDLLGNDRSLLTTDQ